MGTRRNAAVATPMQVLVEDDATTSMVDAPAEPLQVLGGADDPGLDRAAPLVIRTPATPVAGGPAEMTAASFAATLPVLEVDAPRQSLRGDPPSPTAATGNARPDRLPPTHPPSGNVGSSPLIACARRPRQLAKLLSDGADPNEGDKDGHLAIVEAIHARTTDSLVLLIEHGADVNAPCAAREGETPLLRALWRSNHAAVELLLAARADVSLRHPVHRWTPLHVACMTRDRQSVALLVAAGADVNVPDADGVSAVAFAREQGYAELVDAMKGHR